MSIQTHHPANTISTHGQSGASCVSPMSSSSLSYGFTYDVFLNFRGPDTRHGFVGNLWKALHDKGIRTFMDKEDLQRGDEILPLVFKAIEKSRIFIPVFSTNYASSSFCLEELARIFECIDRRKPKDRLVLPVFYDVDPSHVRYQTGSYGEALASHEERLRNFKVKKWKMALERAANLSGWHFKPGNEYEHELIAKMVKEVSDKINRAPLHVDDYPVGLERRVLAVKSLLDVGSDDGAHLVGINGIDGMENNTMVRKHTFVSNIGPKNQTSSLLVRIVRLTEGISKSKAVSKQRIHFSLDLILMDSKGDKIGAHIKRELIYKFENSLEEGMVYYITNFDVDANSGQYRSTRHQYMLNFNIGTIVRFDNKGSIPPSVHSFITPWKVFEDGCDTDYLVDVIGILTGVEKEYQKNGATSKFKVIQLNNAGYCFECTLFGPCMDSLNFFLASGESENAVVAILSAKVKTYLGKPSLQNTFSSTKLLFNPDIAEATELRKSTLENFGSPTHGIYRLPTASKVDISEDLLSLTPRATIASLKESTQESSYSVMGTITEIIDPEDWWYNACICNKSVYPDSDMFFCKKCNKHVSTVTQRYRIKLRVTHGAVSTIFVLFDNNAKSIFHKSCADMIAAIGQGSDSNTLPKEISDLKDKTFIFKVSSKNDTPEGYEKSYRVQRLCSDPEIMLKFNEANLHKDVVGSGFASDPSNVSSPNAMSDVPFTQDLIQKFTTCDVWVASHSKTNEVIELCNDSGHLTPLKRAAPDDGFNVDANEPVKLQIEND